MKKLICVCGAVALAVALSACGRNTEIKTYDQPKDVGIEVKDEMKANEIEEKSEQIPVLEKEISKEEIPDQSNEAIESHETSNSFALNTVHSKDQPGAWGAGYPEMRYFCDDGTYYWQKDDYDYLGRKVATKGIWTLENGKLKLKEEYMLYKVGGTIEWISDPSYEGEGIVGEKIELMETNKEYTYDIKYGGQCGMEHLPDCYAYLLNDENWFSNAAASLDSLYFIKMLQEEIENKYTINSDEVYKLME